MADIDLLRVPSLAFAEAIANKTVASVKETKAIVSCAITSVILSTGLAQTSYGAQLKTSFTKATVVEEVIYLYIDRVTVHWTKYEARTLTACNPVRYII